MLLEKIRTYSFLEQNKDVFKNTKEKNPSLPEKDLEKFIEISTSLFNTFGINQILSQFKEEYLDNSFSTRTIGSVGFFSMEKRTWDIKKKLVHAPEVRFFFNNTIFSWDNSEEIFGEDTENTDDNDNINYGRNNIGIVIVGNISMNLNEDYFLNNTHISIAGNSSELSDEGNNYINEGIVPISFTLGKDGHLFVNDKNCSNLLRKTNGDEIKDECEDIISKIIVRLNTLQKNGKCDFGLRL